ncbi:MAG: PD-(D/E)XK nuclease family protein, partial [Pseudomonadota bacterium]|nr:PD-(D/E)XK nuclease family protein [Pseudomonadota bacterium]
PLDQDPGQAELGQFVHQALEDFVRQCPGEIPDGALEILLDCGKKAFGDHLARPEVWTFWWPRFERVARWFTGWERAHRRSGARPLATEVKGSMTRLSGGGAFTLRARADRIDLLADSSVAILDYKTGAVPTKAEVAAGLSPQLPLEALIMQHSGFEGLESRRTGEMLYLQLSGRSSEPGKAISAGDCLPLVEGALHGLEALVAIFDVPETPYLSRPDPRHAPRYSDYNHLARVGEWGQSNG